ncbi:DUF4157 domain-containing protein [uncultured Aquimarina sp.]|uniref:eCIS core domain-containing protein n=1 Tax=uncultured Aquimarina sp. TaxID=575652 RepID=UPI00261DA8D7|nr:DUF4157 domain-containing protein [uncultured Aquimarina sp.]
MFRTATANTTNTTSNNSLLFLNGKGDSSFIQPKLNIGKPGDKYEVEADRVADTIVSKGKEQPSAFFDATSGVQTQKEDVQKSEEKENIIQEKPLVENITPLIQKQSEEIPIQEKEEQEEVQKQSEEEIQKQEIPEETQIQEKTVEENNTPLVQQQTEEDPIQEKEEQEEIQQKPEEEIQQKVEDEVQKQEIIPEPPAPEVIESNSTVPDVQNVEEEVQEKEEEEEEEQLQEKKFVQKVEEPDGNTASETSSIESQLNSTSGGSSLPKDTQSQMESGFGTDFSNVRIHTDSSAVQMNKDLGAQAFTHGNDIYFNEGKYDTSSDSGNHLLAHELTHTVQQGASIQPKMIQKADDDSAYDKDNFTISFKGMNININIPPSGDTIRIDKLPMGAYKTALHNKKRPFTRPKGYKRDASEENNNQRELWMNALSNTSAITDFVSKKIQTEYRELPKNNKIYVFKVPGGKGKNNRRIIGAPNQIHREFTLPSWRINGSSRWFQVDHMQELQLGGENNINNFNLLNEDSNRSYGYSINRHLTSIAKRISDHEKDNPEGIRSTLSNADKVKQNWALQFLNAVDDPQSKASSNPSHWNYSQILGGEHLKIGKKIELETINSLGDASKVFVFPFENGGVGKRFKNNESVIKSEKMWLNPWLITSKTFNTEEGTENSGVLGSFNFELKENEVADATDATPIQVNRYRGARYAGFLDVNRFFLSQYNWQGFGIKKFSPVTFERAIMDPQRGLVIRGKVNPTLSLIEGTTLDLEVASGDISVSKIFDTGSFSFPSPFEINDSSLELSLSIKKGLKVKGKVDFGINQVGEGSISAVASKAGGLELTGTFNFDSKLFDPAEIKVAYKDNIWTIGGEIGIPEGKVPGVEKATLTVSYSENNFAAEGEADLDVPGVDSSRLGVKYGENGFSVEGEFALNSDLPGIKSGNVKAKIAKKEGAEDYDIFVSGKAKPDIPGIDSEIDITYDNGALLIQGKTKVKLEKSKADGEVTIGITNQVIGADNKPTGEISESWSVFGSGDVSFVLTKGIVAKAKVVLQPNGDILVSGGVELDRSDKKPKEKTFDKNLFKIGPPDIILFALPIGVSLTLGIEGRADIYASFIPPYFKELQLSFDNFNLTKPEENTEIAGKIIVAMSGKGGVKLSLTLSATLSALIAKVTGSLIGSIGLEVNAEALAELGAKWSNENGLEIEKGEISLEADAQFLAELKGKIRVYLDLWLAEIDIWEEELEIAKVKFGDSLKVGFKLPLSTENGELKAGEINKDSFTYPDVSSDSEQQKIVEQGAKQDEKVKEPPPPSKEEAVAAVRKLDAGPVDFFNALTMDADQARVLVTFNWITRDTYILWLKLNHPKIDWSQPTAVGRKKDEADFESFKGEIKGMPQGFFRIARVANFKEDHYLFTKSKKNEINQLMTPEEELV